MWVPALREVQAVRQGEALICHAFGQCYAQDGKVNHSIYPTKMNIDVKEVEDASIVLCGMSDLHR